MTCLSRDPRNAFRSDGVSGALSKYFAILPVRRSIIPANFFGGPILLHDSHVFGGHTGEIEQIASGTAQGFDGYREAFVRSGEFGFICSIMRVIDTLIYVRDRSVVTGASPFVSLIIRASSTRTLQLWLEFFKAVVQWPLGIILERDPFTGCFLRNS